MKTIHPAIAEHVMEENEKLRGLLRDLRPVATENGYYGLAARIDTALSQQAEPAPAQDERDSVITHIELCITNLKAEHQTNPRVIAEVLYNIGYSRATRPAQTEQQPVGYQFQDREGVWKQFMSEKHYEDTLADGTWPIRAIYAAPIAQAAPQREQSGWISVEDRLPEPGRYGARVMCWGEGWSQPREMKWAANTSAKTEAGRRPRWEETYGRLAFSAPTHWMPLPAAPGLSAQGTSK